MVKERSMKVLSWIRELDWVSALWKCGWGVFIGSLVVTLLFDCCHYIEVEEEWFSEILHVVSFSIFNIGDYLPLCLLFVVLNLVLLFRLKNTWIGQDVVYGFRYVYGIIFNILIIIEFIPWSGRIREWDEMGPVDPEIDFFLNCYSYFVFWLDIFLIGLFVWKKVQGWREKDEELIA